MYEKIINEFILSDERHEWYIKGFDKEKLKEIQKYYQERYQQKVN